MIVYAHKKLKKMHRKLSVVTDVRGRAFSVPSYKFYF